MEGASLGEGTLLSNHSGALCLSSGERRLHYQHLSLNVAFIPYYWRAEMVVGCPRVHHHLLRHIRSVQVVASGSASCGAVGDVKGYGFFSQYPVRIFS